MKSVHQIARRIRQRLECRPDLRLDARLAHMEKVFRAPPMTEELAAAIRLISPQFPIRANEQDRAFWEADQNGACWGEYEALESLLRAMPKPHKILEIGPGMGRSLVFLSKKQEWENAALHAFDGTGHRTRYAVLGPRFEDSFCGNLEMLRRVLDYNGVRNVTIFDAARTKLAELPGPYDFLYSFYGVGFHWSLQHFLADLLPLMHDDSVAVFTVPMEFAPFRELSPLACRIIEWKPVWPADSHLKLLVLGKKALPAF